MEKSTPLDIKEVPAPIAEAISLDIENAENPAVEPVHEPAIPPPVVFFVGAMAGAMFFTVWSWLVFSKEGTIPDFDYACAEFWHDWSQPHNRLWSFMVFLTDIGGVASMALLTIMGAIWQSAIKHRFLAVAWFGIIIGGGLLNVATKSGFDRDRPPESLRDRAVLESNKSYPSGHSMGAVIGYGMLAYALVLPQRSRPRRIVAILVLVALVLGIGFSRMYLRAHWFSDVIGGWSIGLTWVLFCIGCLELRRRRLPA
jgi:membrane-associated phospholipid phosphatase